MLSSDHLRKKLLLENKPNEGGYTAQDFSNDLNYYYFQSRLLIGQEEDEVLDGFTKDDFVEPNIESECRFIIRSGEMEGMMKELFFHLQRSKMKFPGIILPELLAQIKNTPGLWRLAYNNCHGLALKLSLSHPEWEFYSRAFDPEIDLIVGSYQFYECLQFRMLIFPVKTEKFILDQFDIVSSHHQAKMIKILALDNAPHLAEFLRSKLKTGSKEVRIAALKSLLRSKDETIYNPVAEIVKRIYVNEESLSHEKALKELNFRINDLKAITLDGAVRERLLQVVDPGDCKLTNSEGPEGQFLVEGAKFHRDQEFLMDYILDGQKGMLEDSVVEALTPGSCSILMDTFLLRDVQWGSTLFKKTLDKIFPFLNVDQSEKIWKHLKYQLSEFFFHDFIPLDTVVSKIHPNYIKNILYDDILVGEEEWKISAKGILDTRRLILKEIYPK
ncbi:HEAT repeat domain-containing protein [Membranihabitans maritimus]|uniref:HEAT repeat domain-containing protein n=1 Tax=Membranihabitans maritimus TaxID=2904244 RepID=UPI001F31B753|nr:HEAT repeat domain-containing protein [Membranihabitans maritimus]